MSATPLIALDMDGVLRPLREPTNDDIAVECGFLRGEYPDLFHRQPNWDDDGISRSTVYLSRPAVEWVRSLVERGFDVQWATTWQGWANTYFAASLGFTLPVAVEGRKHLRVGGHSAPEWKASSLAREFPDRPILWIDDNPPWTDRSGLFLRDDFLFVKPECEVGIDPENIAEAEAWLKRMSS